jgi:hypothetical protein
MGLPLEASYDHLLDTPAFHPTPRKDKSLVGFLVQRKPIGQKDSRAENFVKQDFRDLKFCHKDGEEMPHR